MVDGEGGHLHAGRDEEDSGVDDVGCELSVGRGALIVLGGVRHGQHLREGVEMDGELAHQRQDDARAEHATGRPCRRKPLEWLRNSNTTQQSSA